MNLNLSEEQQFIQQTAADFAAKELVPNAAKLDEGKGREDF
ncbi:MAG: alkylation response protein AidB-like acyl-CoA dehydrogenase [Zhongshania sp.]|jgi:alkylation response protein AidB-like acyl-CoA dehydrogenase